jgi:hypothetical protein
MPKMPFEWTFGYADIAKLTGLSNNAIHQAVARGTLEPGSLESLLIWMSRQAKPSVRHKMVRHALGEDTDTRTMIAKRKRGVDKAG